jgi:hypothetical protein
VTDTVPVVYVYSFSVWPDETWKFTRSLYDYFRMINTLVEMNFTQDQFERFRSEMSHDGMTLREVGRWPYHEPEVVL